VSTQNWLVVVVLAVVVVVVVAAVVKRNTGKGARSGSGLSVGDYAAGTAPIDIALGELSNACTFFEKRRSQAKYKAENVLLATRIANGCIAVIGVLVTFEGWSRWGIVSTALAALVAGIAEWDAHYRHRELWIQRTVVLSKLQYLLRDARYQMARGSKDANEVADDVMAELGRMLDEDLRNWTSMRGDTDDPPQQDKDSRDAAGDKSDVGGGASPATTGV